MKQESKIDPMDGVVKPEILAVHIRQACRGNRNSLSYVRGAHQWLKKHPPNKYIVPLLAKAMEKAREV